MINRIFFFRICLICGAEALNNHYGCRCCDPCRKWYRRNFENASNLTSKLNCEGTCIIDVNNRANCHLCRMQKCLDNLMPPDTDRRPLSRYEKKTSHQVWNFLMLSFFFPHTVPVSFVAISRTSCTMESTRVTPVASLSKDSPLWRIKSAKTRIG